MTEVPDDPRIAVLILYPGIKSLPHADRVPRLPDLYQRILGDNLATRHGVTDDGQQLTFYVNADAKTLRHDPNPVATRLWHALDPAVPDAETLYGTAIVVGKDGDADADVPAAVVETCQKIFRQVEIERHKRALRELRKQQQGENK
jgi:hypothetical protein